MKKILFWSLVCFVLEADVSAVQMFYQNPTNTPLVNPAPIKSSQKGVKKHKFSQEEDIQLRELVNKYGTADWELIAGLMPGRNPRQCRERWSLYLSPNTGNNKWTREDEGLLWKLVNQIGKQWKRISTYFSDKNEVAVKNRYEMLLRRNNRWGNIYGVEPATSQTIPIPIVKGEQSQELIEDTIEANKIDVEMKTEELSDPLIEWGWRLIYDI